jgi:hypothetical protein
VTDLSFFHKGALKTILHEVAEMPELDFLTVGLAAKERKRRERMGERRRLILCVIWV